MAKRLVKYVVNKKDIIDTVFICEFFRLIHDIVRIPAPYAAAVKIRICAVYAVERASSLGLHIGHPAKLKVPCIIQKPSCRPCKISRKACWVLIEPVVLHIGKVFDGINPHIIIFGVGVNIFIAYISSCKLPDGILAFTHNPELKAKVS